eukprot:scaffold8881_cov199-Skeletonema_marinoi.AAC.4
MQLKISIIEEERARRMHAMIAVCPAISSDMRLYLQMYVSGRRIITSPQKSFWTKTTTKATAYIIALCQRCD